MALVLVSVRLIDLAIFASLGGLWIAGSLFIVALYRWILRFERGSRDASQIVTAVEPEADAARPRERARRVPRLPAHTALGQQA